MKVNFLVGLLFVLFAFMFFFAYFYFVGDILGSFCPFEQCFVYNVHQEITALAMYQPIDIFSSSLYMILNDFIAQQI